MADTPNNEPNSNDKMTRRNTRRSTRQKSSASEITGRIRTRKNLRQTGDDRRKSKTPKDTVGEYAFSEGMRFKPETLEPHLRRLVNRALRGEELSRPERISISHIRVEPKPGRKYWRKMFAKTGTDLRSPSYGDGFGSPKETTKFSSGECGNPKGRPKGAKGSNTLLNKALDQKIISRANGKQKQITTREGIIMRLVKKALDGDHNAIKLIMAKDEDFEFRSIDQDNPQNVQESASEVDEEIIAEFERQILERAQLNQNDRVNTFSQENDDDDA